MHFGTATLRGRFRPAGWRRRARPQAQSAARSRSRSRRASSAPACRCSTAACARVTCSPARPIPRRTSSRATLSSRRQPARGARRVHAARHQPTAGAARDELLLRGAPARQARLVRRRLRGRAAPQRLRHELRPAAGGRPRAPVGAGGVRSAISEPRPRRQRRRVHARGDLRDRQVRREDLAADARAGGTGGARQGREAARRDAAHRPQPGACGQHRGRMPSARPKPITSAENRLERMRAGRQRGEGLARRGHAGHKPACRAGARAITAASQFGATISRPPAACTASTSAAESRAAADQRIVRRHAHDGRDRLQRTGAIQRHLDDAQTDIEQRVRDLGGALGFRGRAAALPEHLARQGHLPRVRQRLRQEGQRHGRRPPEDRGAARRRGGAGLPAARRR